MRCWIEETLSLAPALVFWRIGDAAEAKHVQVVVGKGSPLKIVSVQSSNPRLPATLRAASEGGAPSIAVQPASTARQETAQISVVTDYPPDAPKTYILHARIK